MGTPPLIDKHSRNEHDIPIPLLQLSLVQPFKVDGLLLELVERRGREVAMGCDRASVFTDSREPGRLKDFSQDVFSCRTRRTENEDWMVLYPKYSVTRVGFIRARRSRTGKRSSHVSWIFCFQSQHCS